MENKGLTSLTHLECSLCSAKFSCSDPQNLCACGGPLLVRYNLDRIRLEWSRGQIVNRRSIWRYAPVLPVASPAHIISLGEGWTPLLAAPRTAARLGVPNLLIKDEGMNPTGSFKARGLSCAISKCVELGIRKVAVPSAGNAASATAAYAAAAGIEAHIFMPRDVPQTNFIECQAYGARDRTAFTSAVRLVISWGFGFALAVAAIFALFGPGLIDIMTANVEVRGIARDYLWFVVVSPMLAVCAFGYDGVYIGATWARDMRNLMVLSLLIFFTAWFSLRSHGNAGLWGALLVHYAARGALEALRYPALLRKTFDTKG